MKANQKLSILFRLKLSKENSKGLVPIWVRITVNGVRAEWSTGRQVNSNEWCQDKVQVRDTFEGAAALNDYLLMLRADITKQYNVLMSTNDYVTAEDIKKCYRNSPERVVMFLDVFDQYNQTLILRVENDDLSKGRLKHFEILYQKSEAFIKHKYFKQDLAIKEIKVSFINEFYLYLKTTEGISQNTSMKHTKNLKQVMDYAVMLEYIPSNPFQFFKCSFKRSNRTKLTSQEVDLIYKKEIKNPRLREVRDCYIFAIHTGYAYQELYDLTFDNIQFGLDGRKWIIKMRGKTDTIENVPLLPVALEIIERYKGHPYCKANNKLLPVNSNQRYNEYLKEVAAICDIDKVLTTHTARHTFATTVTLENGIPLETVSKMLGHTDIKTTQIYAEITQTRISEDMAGLHDKIVKRSKMNALSMQA